ncbi:carbon starvation CstA family protein [Thermoflexus sp.]|uniref:carbon starvation CstA family protein n=1 Tax=Thermoflexus sp. TaxID=1969742 RepID=UPI0025F7A462|nr:carbon starvation CstA family protein [Thermoflexus sp.]MDW8181196.1 carbon starvation CstA family protein [Anaerolineae bacterium]MCS6964547.1 carbon starvation protein A [Thermoflexus sp.]MCS7351738.1 carbon starvation protein A [Thermoflexus sp.]MCX7690917.1 carbon starvation protein A [Thermoflexus sp.]MDW8183848.1 carbon starvation CstA family protein [Anaerolineae bacterium]
MSAFWVIIIGILVQLLIWNLYAKRVDREIIQSDPKRATPARMYMDGVDFVPTSRNILIGYHFKSIAAAGPIVGPITAAGLWGWLPALLWLILGVSFIGWASDYSAIMLSVRNDGNSLSAVAYRLISPRTRTLLFVFIFFYLLLIAGAFVNLIAGVLLDPTVPLGIIALAAMGLLAGQMLYRWKIDLIAVTAITLIITLVAMGVGPLGLQQVKEGEQVKTIQGPVGQVFASFNAGIDSLVGGKPLYTYFDPTANPDPKTGRLLGLDRPVRLSYIFWMLFTLVFCYLGANLPIWRFAQPVNYLGFWVTALVIILSYIGGIVGFFTNPQAVSFKLPAFRGFQPAAIGIQPLWPMLFVTIACGAISGWHALFGSVGTARQLEYETDALPVGGGAMLFGENTLGLLSLIAIALNAPGATAPERFASGVGILLSQLFGEGFFLYGKALGFAAFVVIVITVVQLVFRLMRVTLGEWLGEAQPIFKNMHVASIISMILAAFLVLTGTWIYLWQLFGSANQLMAGLALLIVTVWLVSERRPAWYAGVPGVFMYITTMAAILVTLYNQIPALNAALARGNIVAIIGAGTMLVLAALLFIAAAFIGYEGWVAFNRWRAAPARPAPAGGGGE